MESGQADVVFEAACSNFDVGRGRCMRRGIGGGKPVRVGVHDGGVVGRGDSACSRAVEVLVLASAMRR